MCWAKDYNSSVLRAVSEQPAPQFLVASAAVCVLGCLVGALLPIVVGSSAAFTGSVTSSGLLGLVFTVRNLQLLRVTGEPSLPPAVLTTIFGGWFMLVPSRHVSAVSRPQEHSSPEQSSRRSDCTSRSPGWPTGQRRQPRQLFTDRSGELCGNNVDSALNVWMSPCSDILAALFSVDSDRAIVEELGRQQYGAHSRRRRPESDTRRPPLAALAATVPAGPVAQRPTPPGQRLSPVTGGTYCSKGCETQTCADSRFQL